MQDLERTHQSWLEIFDNRFGQGRRESGARAAIPSFNQMRQGGGIGEHAESDAHEFHRLRVSILRAYARAIPSSPSSLGRAREIRCDIPEF